MHGGVLGKGIEMGVSEFGLKPPGMNHGEKQNGVQKRGGALPVS